MYIYSVEEPSLVWTAMKKTPTMHNSNFKQEHLVGEGSGNTALRFMVIQWSVCHSKVTLTDSQWLSSFVSHSEATHWPTTTYYQLICHNIQTYFILFIYILFTVKKTVQGKKKKKRKQQERPQTHSNSIHNYFHTAQEHTFWLEVLYNLFSCIRGSNITEILGNTESCCVWISCNFMRFSSVSFLINEKTCSWVRQSIVNGYRRHARKILGGGGSSCSCSLLQPPPSISLGCLL